MSNVLHRTTMQYLQSVNTPDYLSADWVINPDLSGVVGIPQKYWKLTGDTVSEMTQEEKDAVDAAVTPTVQFHASSKLISDEVNITEGGPGWQELGGAVTTPSFFTVNVASCKGRIVGQYKTSGAGAKLRFCEDGVDSGQFELPDSAGSWATMQWFTDAAPTTGTHTYTLEGQLNGATAAAFRFVAVSLLEFH